MNRSHLLPFDWPDLVEQWSAQASPPLNQASLRRYKNCLLAFLTWFEQAQRRSLSLADLNSTTLIGYRAGLQQTAATSTVNIHLCALRSWCTYLVEQNYLSVNPASRLKLIGRSNPLAPTALSPTQLNTLLRQAVHTRYGPRNSAIIHMLVQTGLRIGECANLQLEDLLFGERTGQVLVRAGKGNKARTVPLNGSVRQALALYLAPRFEVEATLKAVAAAWPKSLPSTKVAALWHSERGNQLSLREMNRTLHLLFQQCSNHQLLPAGFTAHSLRHTFATAYLQRNPTDLVGLARLLGHSSLDTTRIYVEPTALELTRRVEAIELNIYVSSQ